MIRYLFAVIVALCLGCQEGHHYDTGGASFATPKTTTLQATVESVRKPDGATSVRFCTTKGSFDSDHEAFCKLQTGDVVEVIVIWKSAGNEVADARHVGPASGGPWLFAQWVRDEVR